jgi:hypothetical protein
MSLGRFQVITSLTHPDDRHLSPGALNPIEINREKEEGIYIEPNARIVHEIG